MVSCVYLLPHYLVRMERKITEALVKQLISRVINYYNHPSRLFYYKAIRSNNLKNKLIFLIFKVVSYFRILTPFVNFLIAKFTGKIRIPLMHDSFFCYGLASNNEEMFCKLIDVIGKNNNKFEINGCKVSYFSTARLKIRDFDYSLFNVPKNIYYENIFVKLQVYQCVAYLNAFMKIFSISRPQILISGNDHSPVDMAAIFAAKALNIKTVYIQHASVNDSFPPLCTDLSILHDIASVVSYGFKVDDIHSDKITILPPYSDQAILPKLKKNKFIFSIMLGTYISKICKSELHKLINKLFNLNCTSSIVIRTHPLFKGVININEISDRPSDVTVNSEDIALPNFLEINDVDIVIAGNSSVIIKCLHYGRPVFYYNNLDKVTFDYYGYLANGVIYDFKEDYEYLVDRVAVMSTSDWKAKYSLYDLTNSKKLSAIHKDLNLKMARLMSRENKLR